MLRFNKPNAAPATITVNTSSNAAKAIATPLAVRVGYRICNAGSNEVYVQEVPVGSSTPTVAQVLAAPTAIIPGYTTWESGAGDLTDIYTGASIASSASIQELL